MLLQRARERLEKGSPEFNDSADTILAILRSQEVVPYKRRSVNGELHKMVAGAIVEAYDRDTTIDVALVTKALSLLRLQHKDRGVP